MEKKSFLLPLGKVAKSFVQETTNLFEAFAKESREYCIECMHADVCVVATETISEN